MCVCVCVCVCILAMLSYSGVCVCLRMGEAVYGHPARPHAMGCVGCRDALMRACLTVDAAARPSFSTLADRTMADHWSVLAAV